jgi:hypothetical protein
VSDYSHFEMGWFLDFLGILFNDLKPSIMFNEKVYNEYYPDHHLSVDEYFEAFSEEREAQLKKTYEQLSERLSKGIENSKTLLSRKDCQVLDGRLFNIMNKNLGRYLRKDFKLPTKQNTWGNNPPDPLPRIFSEFHEWKD